ncbi:MAG: ABC transporter permease [Chitinophagaceae bacterium]|nr:ABC transporter permease [Chitinophagaceae bacterium]
MNKTFLIIQREYLTRVRKRSFIISTLLLPILYLGLIFGTSYIAEKSSTSLNIAIVDSSGYFDRGAIERENQRDSSSRLTYVEMHPDSLKNNFSQLGYDGFLVIPADINWETGEPGGLPIYTSRTFGFEGVAPIKSKLNNIWSAVKNEKLGIDDNKRKILQTSQINLSPRDTNESVSNSGIATTIGYISGFLMYMMILIYGSQVMLGVMEEKTNRIAEVIVSSVKPFQLMLGKIVGIAMVALTQFILWILFMFVIYNVTKSTSAGSDSISSIIGGVQDVFTSVNVPLILFCFIFYMLGGFFFYSSLYAAIGSSVNEGVQEVQSLSFPVTMLVILSLAMMSAAMKDPTGPVAVWGSFIPFSSPIIMMARIPFGVPGTVPWWQLGLSMASLIAGFLFTTWFAAKIYRTGILMYGKKPSWKEMMKWAMRK